MRPRESGTSLSWSHWWMAAALAVALIALRFVHLGADVPVWVAPDSAGEFVDEGYKTLSPRNLLLFGTTHWNPHDDYPGWMDKSPVPSWAYYAAFRAFGTTIEPARVVTVLFFALFLASYFWAMRGRLRFAWLLAGFALLGLDSVLFFFSRIALFEFPLIVFVYGALFVLARCLDRPPWLPVVCVAVFSLLPAFTVKLSALLYFAPIVGALLLRALYLRGTPSGAKGQVALASAVLAGLWLVFFTRYEWLWRIEQLASEDLFWSFLENPFAYLSPFLILSGWLCAIHLLATSFEQVAASAYRSGLVALALLGPLLLGVFPGDPPRYYVPILPAYALLIVEWLQLDVRRRSAVSAPTWLFVLLVPAMGYWLFTAARAFNTLVLQQLPLGEDPGLSEFMLRRLVLGPALAAAFGILLARRRLLHGRVVTPVVAGCLALWTLHAAAGLGSWMIAPSYAGSAVREALVRAVPRGSSLAGDWAPFLALGTDLRPLYMNRYFNGVEHLVELHPEYFVWSDTPHSNDSLAALRHCEAARLGAPLLESTYADTSLVVYPLVYRAEEEAATATATAAANR